MELLNTSPFEVGWLEWEPNAGRPTLTVVVKATYALSAEGPATLLEDQPFVSGDLHYDDDAQMSLRWPSDLWPLKPCGEVLVVGSAHVPLEATQSMAAMRVGAIGKTLALYGDRVWTGAGVSAPEPFTTMPLRWERSFGGPGHDLNPIGVGLARDAEGKFVLPNLEDPAALLSASSERPPPAGLSPIPITFNARMRHGGTYDAAWLESRYPNVADDIDYRMFLASPEDQRVEGFFLGTEEIELRHLHPAHPRVQATLPGDTPVVFTVKAGQLTEAGVRLDTIVIDADEGTVSCVWRGVTEARVENLDALFVHAAEPGDDYAAAYAAAIAPEATEDEEEAEPPPPAPAAAPGSVPPAPAAAPGSVPPGSAPPGSVPPGSAPPGSVPPGETDGPGARWAHLDQAMTVRGDDSALAASLQEELARRQEQERSRVFRPVFEDALGLPAPADPAEELSPEEQLELEMMSALRDMPAAEDASRRLEVRDAVARGESCEGWDLEGVDLGGLDLTGANLRGANLTGANLSGAHLRGVDLEGAVLAQAELSHAVIEDASLVDVELTPVRAEHVRFTRCRFEGTYAVGSYFRSARFLGCTFANADLSQSDISESTFEECALDGGDFSEAELNGAKFTRSTLVDTWMGGVVAERAVFDGCDCSLLRASDEANLVGASFRRCRVDGARFSTSNLRGADFALASAERADFSGALLAQARMMGCVLKKAVFEKATLVQASLMRADLFQARFGGANLKHADLRGANLFQAELFEADLTDARLDLAFLHGTRIA